MHTLAARLPRPLAPLAELACDTRWLWRTECSSLFEALDQRLFAECGSNPIELLLEAAPSVLERRAGDAERLLGRCTNAKAVRAL